MEKDEKFWENYSLKFKEGWNACNTGFSKESCNYVKHSSNYVAWNDGYYEALIRKNKKGNGVFTEFEDE